MLNWLRERKKDNKGFTLVELIIVIAILAILVGLLAPQYMKYVEKSRKSTDVSNLERLVEAVKVASADVDYNIPAGTYTITISGGTSGGTSIAVTGATGSDSSNAETTIKKALAEYAGSDYASIKLKSSRWTSGSSSSTASGGLTNQNNEIKAKVIIAQNSSVTVQYSPGEVESLVK